MKNQYKIAIVPKGAAKVKIDEIRTNIATEYFTNRALENSAHINIIAPFHATEEQISNLITEIREELKFETKFSLLLKRYRFLKHQSRIASLEPHNPKPLINIHKAIRNIFATTQPDIKLVEMKMYQPRLTLAYKDITFIQFEKLRKDYADKSEEIDFKVENIEIWQRIEGEWKTITEIELQSDSFTRILTAGINEYIFTFQPVYSEELNELYYIVTYNGSDFVLAYNNDELQFKVQGQAPYDARTFENELSAMIESYNA